jgi:hypothetical protein
MARVTEGLLQGVHGKLGNFVFRRRNGKTFLTKSPVFRKRKPTERELFAREKFAFMIKFMKPLNVLFHSIHMQPVNGKTGFNLAISHNYHETITGERQPFQVNYPKLVLSRGCLNLPDFIMAASLSPGTISFIWSYDNPFSQTQKVFIAIYCEELDVWRFDTDNANLKDCMRTMDLPDFNGKPVHTYIGFISADGQKVSDSCYTGMVNIV